MAAQRKIKVTRLEEIKEAIGQHRPEFRDNVLKDVVYL
jgi:hypothetical protein